MILLTEMKQQRRLRFYEMAKVWVSVDAFCACIVLLLAAWFGVRVLFLREA